jgi:fatty acid desaturase
MYLAPTYVAANLQSWRKYIEHVGLTGGTVNSSTRSIVAQGWPGRFVALTLLHEPFHGVHHLHMQLPHAELPGRVSELAPQASDEIHPFPSYRHAFLHLLRSLANPRMGAQWHRSAV